MKHKDVQVTLANICSEKVEMYIVVSLQNLYCKIVIDHYSIQVR